MLISKKFPKISLFREQVNIESPKAVTLRGEGMFGGIK